MHWYTIAYAATDVGCGAGLVVLLLVLNCHCGARVAFVLKLLLALLYCWLYGTDAGTGANTGAGTGAATGAGTGARAGTGVSGPALAHSVSGSIATCPILAPRCWRFVCCCCCSAGVSTAAVVSAVHQQ